MKIHKGEAISLILTILLFGVAWYFYPQLPERVASHWNMKGEVDGYMGRFWGAFLFPFIVMGMLLVFLLIPRIDPKKQNIEKFRAHFDHFVLSFLLFMSYVYGLTLAWNLGSQFNITQWLSPAFDVLFYRIGVLIGHAEQNWMIGIRTPWTLSSSVVWQKTHRLGAKLFKVSAFIALLGFVLPDCAMWFVLIPVLVSSLWVCIYSYLEYKKDRKNV